MARVIFYLAMLIASTVFGQQHEKTQVKVAVDTFLKDSITATPRL